jgi:ABC-type branched-subunit amino acid transport system ATPase component
LTASTTPSLTLAGLSAGYGAAPVVRDVTLDIAPGEILAVLGKNGMGKSTLLKAVMGYLASQAGSIRLYGATVSGAPPHRMARQGVAYTPQEQALFPDLSVRENLALGLPDRSRLAAGLDTIGAHFPVLVERLSQKAGVLSGGEQKMLLISRAIIAEPRLMLIDEISEGLQPTMVERMAGVIRAERERRAVSVLLVEQNVPFAFSVADRYAVLKRGEIVDAGLTRDPHALAHVTAQLSV